ATDIRYQRIVGRTLLSRRRVLAQIADDDLHTFLQVGRRHFRACSIVQSEPDAHRFKRTSGVFSPKDGALIAACASAATTAPPATTAPAPPPPSGLLPPLAATPFPPPIPAAATTPSTASSLKSSSASLPTTAPTPSATLRGISSRLRLGILRRGFRNWRGRKW